MTRIAFNVQEAAEAASVSPDLIRKGIHTTDPNTFPPPLAARRSGQGPNAKYVILVEDLRDWVTRFPEG